MPTTPRVPRSLRRPIALTTLLAWSLVALPQVATAADVADAWARSTVKGQLGSVAYFTITSPKAVRLVGASSPVAGVVQVHEMAMQGTTMKMRPVPAVDLPAGQPVEFKSGGLHVMLMDLKQPLANGERLPLTLRLEGADHAVVEQTVSIEVRDAAPTIHSR